MLKQCCTVVSPTCSHQAEGVHIPALPNAEGPVLRLHVSRGAPGGVHNHHSASQRHLIYGNQSPACRRLGCKRGP